MNEQVSFKILKTNGNEETMKNIASGMTELAEETDDTQYLTNTIPVNLMTITPLLQGDKLSVEIDPPSPSPLYITVSPIPQSSLLSSCSVNYPVTSNLLTFKECPV